MNSSDLHTVSGGNDVVTGFKFSFENSRFSGLSFTADGEGSSHPFTVC